MQRLGFHLLRKDKTGYINYFRSKASTYSFKNNISSNRKKYLLYITTAATATSVIYTINKKQVHASEKDEHFSETKQKQKPITLYQYATCPFCCKVRTYLEFYGMEYNIIEVNPVTRKEIKFSEYRKVPILKVNDIQLNDSSLIISVLKSNLLGKGDLAKLVTYYPVLESADGKSKEYQNRYNIMYNEGFGKELNDKIREELKWRAWVDHTFVHTLSPNIYRTMKESFQAMEYITHVGNFLNFERQLVYYSGAFAMYIIGWRVKKRHNLKDDVRESMYFEAQKWIRAIGKKRKFMGGNVPNLADLNMYGVISAIEGLDAFHDLMKNTNIEPWYKRMKKQVQSHAGAKQPDWLLGNFRAS